MSKILLIDDLPDFVEAEKAYLEEYDEGFEIETLSDPEAALDLVHRETFDLIILDIMMPKKDGLQILKEIRACSDVPVIIYSAYVHLYPPQELLDQGASVVISKPANMEFLIERIREL